VKVLREHIFPSFSVPEVIVSDNAQCFTSREFQNFCFDMGIRHVTTSPFAVMFSFRASSPLLNKWKIHELLPEKCNSRSLRERWNSVRRNLVNSRNAVERRYNQNRLPNPFKVGDMVYYKNHPISSAGNQISAKLMPRYKGPFKIQSLLTPVTVRLADTVTVHWVTRAHVSLLKPGTAGTN
jgi:hypothetical protein